MRRTTTLSLSTFCLCASAIAVAVYSTAAACAQTDASSATCTLGQAQVTIPVGITFTKRRGPDFDLYYFNAASADSKPRQILFAYSGSAPAFPKNAPKGTREKRVKFAGNAARSLAWTTPTGHCREVLVQVKGSIGKYAFNEQEHFIYTNLSDADATLADTIIASVQRKHK